MLNLAHVNPLLLFLDQTVLLVSLVARPAVWPDETGEHGGSSLAEYVEYVYCDLSRCKYRVHVPLDQMKKQLAHPNINELVYKVEQGEVFVEESKSADGMITQFMEIVNTEAQVKVTLVEAIVINLICPVSHFILSLVLILIINLGSFFYCILSKCMITF